MRGAPPATTLKNQAFVTPNMFRFQFDSVAGKNYTIQFSSNLLSWPTLFLTNAAFSSVAVTDQVIGISRQYRVISGP